MKKTIYIITLLLALSGCDRDRLFKLEQYKNVFAFVSNTDNIYECYFDLEDQTSDGYLSFSMGGTNATEEDVTIHIVEDKAILDKYNRTNYDVDVERYARLMPSGKYSVGSYECTIRAGEVKASVPVSVSPEGLSPDSTYFIPFRVDSYNRYEVNPEKSSVLFRVRIENYWANDAGTSYTQRGFKKVVGTSSETMVPGVKVMYPISKNRVRVMAGSETFEPEKETINKGAIILEVDENENVTILPYRNIKVRQVDGDEEFPNKFMIEDDGFKTYKTFLLHYIYEYEGVEYEMTEELRLEFDPDAEE